MKARLALTFILPIFILTAGPTLVFAVEGPDTTPPEVTIRSDVDGIPIYGIAQVHFDVQFSEPVTDFTVPLPADDFDNIVGDTIDADSFVDVGGTHTHYTFSVTAAEESTVQFRIKDGQVHDSSGNGNVGTIVVEWIYNSSFAPPSAVTLDGFLWNDTDADGVRDHVFQCEGGGDNCAPIPTENVLSGRNVTASPVLDDGSSDPDRTAKSATTDSGLYAFEFDAADIGLWRILQEVPAGWVQTAPSSDTGAFYDIEVVEDGGLLIRQNNYESITDFRFGSREDVTVDAPTASPATTTVYTSAQSVTLSAASTTAAIRYTTDDTEPLCATATLFQSGTPIAVSASMTIKAIACTPQATSSVASFAYVINIPPEVAAPTASPEGGTYTSAQNVTLSAASTTATIRYTVDGTDPLCATSALFASATPIAVSASQTIKAVACTPQATSTAASFAYVIQIQENNSGSGGSGGGGSGGGGGQPFGSSATAPGSITVNPPPPSAPAPAPAQPQGEVLGAQTGPASSGPNNGEETAGIGTFAPAPSSVPEPEPQTQNAEEPKQEELTAPVIPTEQAAAAGFSLSDIPNWLWLLILLLIALGLGFWQYLKRSNPGQAQR